MITGLGTPTPSVESIQWTLDGEDIAGATGMSLTKANLEAGDVVSFRYVLANGILPKFEGVATNPVTISPLPQITAVVSPTPLRPGEPFSVVFSVAPDTATVAAIPGGTTTALSGTGQQRSGTAPRSGRIAISAERTDYADFEMEYEIVPRPAAFVAEDATVRFDNLVAPVTIAVSQPAKWSGTYTIPAVAPDGPVGVKQPSISGEAEVGGVLVLDPGIWASEHPSEANVLEWEWPDGSRALSYTVRAEDAGTDVAVTGAASDPSDTTTFTTVAIAIPTGAGLDAGMTLLSTKSGGVMASGSGTRVMQIDIGPADPDKVVCVVMGMQGFPSAPVIIANGVEYPATHVDYQSTNSYRIGIMTIPCPAGGVVTLRVTSSASTANEPAVAVFALKDMQLVTPVTKAGLTLTGGTATTSTVTTQAGDQVVMAIIQQATNGSEGFVSPTGMTEVMDANAEASTRMFVGIGAATGTQKTVGVTPVLSGACARITAVFRSV